MPRFFDALHEWGSDRFSEALKREILGMTSGSLPLHLAVAQGGIVDDSKLDATVLSIADSDCTIQARVGIFFTEIVGGCSCGDDPTHTNAYCEILVSIDKETATAKLAVI